MNRTKGNGIKNRLGVRGHRAREVFAVVVSAASLTGCASALGELDPRADPADNEPSQQTEVSEPSLQREAELIAERVERYLAPYIDMDQGAVRKVGSDWYERSEDGWNALTGDDHEGRPDWSLPG